MESGQLSLYSGRRRAPMPGFDSHQVQGFSLLHRALGPTQPPVGLVPGALSPSVKWPGREVDH
jgi:hypothetical protein